MVKPQREVPSIVGVPAVALILVGGYMTFAGLANVVAGATGAWRLWGLVLLAVGLAGLLAGVGLFRGLRSAWLAGLIVLPLMTVVDVAFALWQSERVGFGFWAVLAWIVLVLPKVRRAFA